MSFFPPHNKSRCKLMQLPAYMTALSPLKRSDAKTLDYLTRPVGFVMTPVTKNVNSPVALIRTNLAPFSFSYRQQTHPFIISDLITGNWRQSQLTLGEQTGRQFITELTHAGQTTINTPVHTCMQFRSASLPNLHVFGLQEDTGQNNFSCLVISPNVWVDQII